MQFGKGSQVALGTDDQGIIGETGSCRFDRSYDHCHFQFAGERLEPGQSFCFRSTDDLSRVGKAEIGFIE